MIRVLWLDGSNFLGAIAMHERKDFWDKNAGRYDRFMRNDRAAYEKMYGLIRPVVKEKPYWRLPPARGLSQRAS